MDSDSKGLTALKPVSGGNVLATYGTKEGWPQIATIRRRAMEPLEGMTAAREKSWMYCRG